MNLQEYITHAIHHLRNGGVIITPSESCYGLSCDAFNKDAVTSLHQLKQEPLNKPLTVLVSSLDQIAEITVLNETARKLSNHFHPGPLSLVVPLKDAEKYHYLSSNGTLSFRIPGNAMLLQLVQAYGKPITTTSANIHGESAIYLADEIRNHPTFSKLYAILQPDSKDKPLPSTLYSCIDNAIIRQGPITKDQIDRVLQK